MSNLIQIKRSAVSANPVSLANGELAYTSNGDVLYIGSPNGSIVGIGGARSPGILTANQAIVTNSTSYVDNVKAANLVASAGLTVSGYTINTISNTSSATQLGANASGGGISTELVSSAAIVNYVSYKTAAAVGANGQFLFNNSGAVTGTNNFTYDYTSGALTVGNSTVNVQIGYVSGGGQQLQDQQGQQGEQRDAAIATQQRLDRVVAHPQHLGEGQGHGPHRGAPEGLGHPGGQGLEQFLQAWPPAGGHQGHQRPRHQAGQQPQAQIQGELHQGAHLIGRQPQDRIVPQAELGDQGRGDRRHQHGPQAGPALDGAEAALEGEEHPGDGCLDVWRGLGTHRTAGSGTGGYGALSGHVCLHLAQARQHFGSIGRRIARDRLRWHHRLSESRA